MEGVWEARTRSWLQTCYELARTRLPSEVFEEIPQDLWRVAPMGRYLILRRFPRTSKFGHIIIPEDAKAPIAAGWALVPGPDVARAGPNVPHVWLGDLRELVGQPLILLPGRGTVLRLSLVQPQYRGDYIQVHIGDVIGVMVGLDPDYWRPEKANPF